MFGGVTCVCVWELLRIELLVVGKLAVLGQLVEPPFVGPWQVSRFFFFFLGVTYDL